MKYLNFISLTFLISTTSVANEAFNNSLPMESKMVTNYKNEQDPKKKKELEEKFIMDCPFRRKDSSLSALTKEAITLYSSASISNEKYNQCQSQLKDFKESVEKTKDLQAIVNNPEIKLNQANSNTIEEGIKNTQIAGFAFNNLLQSGCEFENSPRNISNIGNQLIRMLDASTTILAQTSPQAGLIAAGSSISGRIVISLSRWLLANNKNQEIIKDVNDESRFINDLCSFRSLAYKYDDLYSNSLKNPADLINERVKIKDQATQAANEVRQCLPPPANDSLTNLINLSNELKGINSTPGIQEKCIDLLNKFNEIQKKEGPNHLLNLAQSLECSNPKEDSTQYVKSFCKAFSSVEDMRTGDIYEKCEDEKFQKQVNAKFTTLTKLLFDVAKFNPQPAVVVNKDLLERLKILEREEKIATQKLEALKISLEESPLSIVESAKSMKAIGNTVLGSRFNDFSDNVKKNVTNSIRQSHDLMKKLFKLKKKADTDEEKQTLCNGAAQLNYQLKTAYQSTLGVKEICTFMEGKGIPPLKSDALNFDNYSFTKEKKFLFFYKRDNYLSNRCNKIKAFADKYIMVINKMNQNASALGCSY